MYLVGLLVMSQVADGLTFTPAHHGVELDPLSAHLGALVLPVKLAGATKVGFLAWRLRGHPRARGLGRRSPRFSRVAGRTTRR